MKLPTPRPTTVRNVVRQRGSGLDVYSQPLPFGWTSDPAKVHVHHLRKMRHGPAAATREVRVCRSFKPCGYLECGSCCFCILPLSLPCSDPVSESTGSHLSNWAISVETLEVELSSARSCYFPEERSTEMKAVYLRKHRLLVNVNQMLSDTHRLCHCLGRRV